MAGKGFVPGNGAPHAQEKVKFTVSVCGHQWSSARHVEETLEEFARVIQRNARRLDFIGENDRIQRLLLAKADGSEPEELDVDATLEDVIICMGNKHLVASIIPANANSTAAVPTAPTATAPCSRWREALKLGPSCPLPFLPSQLKPSDHTDCTSTSCGLATPMSVPSGTVGLQPAPGLSRIGVATCEPPLRGLKISIPSSDPKSVGAIHHERGVLPNASEGTFIGSTTATTPSTLSPAELVHFLVKGSNRPPHRPTSVSDNINSMYFQRFGNGTPLHGFPSFASALLSRLPPVMPPPPVVAHGPPTDNLAMLAQFLAAQLRAFAPGSIGVPPHIPADGTHPPVNKTEPSTTGEEAVSNSNKPAEGCCCKAREKPVETSCPRNCRHSFENDLDTPTNKVRGSHDKDDNSSSANANVIAAPSDDDLKSENKHGASELIFLVNRRSKTGAGAHHLKLSDLSVYFHLSVVDAAKKLCVSQTTLKKACRKFGLKRWPGRKVRSLESTIHGLEHTIAVGQGAGLEQLTEAYMRSEVTKLQQEMDQLVHGSLAKQHSPVVRTADLYKRLYSRGWRSKYHNPSFDLDLNICMENKNNDLTLSVNEELEKGEKGVKKVTTVKPKCQLDTTGPGIPHELIDRYDCKENPSDCKGSSECEAGTGGLTISSDGNENCVGGEGVGCEEVIDSYAHASRPLPPKHLDNVAKNCTQKVVKDNTTLEVDELAKDHDLLPERTSKRPKLEVT